MVFNATLALPFLLDALVAGVAAFVHAWNLLVALTLVAIGGALFFAKRFSLRHGLHGDPSKDGFVEAQIKRCRAHLQRNPEDCETWCALGAAYGKLRRFEDALECFDKAMQIAPDNPDVLSGLAVTYGFLGRVDDKIAVLQAVVELRPTDALAHANLGSALGKTGQHKEAIRCLRAADNIRPDIPDVILGLGLAYVAAGDKRDANTELDRLRVLDAKLALELERLIEMM